MSEEERKSHICRERECLVLSNKNQNKRFTILHLECWQRLYDHRPYGNFILTHHQFESSVNRSFEEDDFNVVIDFLRNNHVRLQRVMIFYIPLDLNFLRLRDFITFTLNVVELNLTGVNLSVTFVELLSYKCLESKIKTLNLSCNQLNKCHLQYLRYFLIKNDELEDLNVAHCNVTEINLSILADGIYNSKSLKSLNINGGIQTFLPNHTDKVAMTVASIFMKNKLTEINLSQCLTDFSGIEYIAEYLAVSGTCLTRLYLARNNIGPDGIKIIFESIAVTKTLKILDISANRIKDLGGQIIGQMLSRTMLTHLNIKHNNLSSETMNFILCSMRKPLLLEKLWISGNTFDCRSARIIKRIIESNTMKIESFDVKIYERDDEHVIFDVVQNPEYLVPDKKLVPKNFLEIEKNIFESVF